MIKTLAAPALPDTRVPSNPTFFGFFSEIHPQAGASLNARRSTGSGERQETLGLALRRGYAERGRTVP